MATPAATALEAPSQHLSSAELETVLAYAEVLVESRALSSEERGHLVEHLEESLRQSTDKLALYRTTVRVLDRLAGVRFAGLAFRERAALIARHRLDRRPDNADDVSGPMGRDTFAVRMRVLPELIEGYWASPAGWNAIGYATFPGRCGDLERYTRPEV